MTRPIYRQGIYLDHTFKHRRSVPMREKAIAAFLIGMVLGVAIIGVGWFVYEFVQRLNA